MLKGETFSQFYWQKPHLALSDIVRQRGFPPLFTTEAPHEWSLQYHVTLLDAMQQYRKPRQELPLFETLHMAHCLLETTWSLFAGKHGEAKSNDFQIMPAVDAHGSPVDFFPVQRLEFQDGTHKEPTQGYHGSGRPHCHGAGWGADPQKWKLHEWASATLPAAADDAEMRCYVKGSQYDKNQKTPWPVHRGPSAWDPEANTYRLHHTEQDHANGLRAFMKIPMKAKKCHQDL
eukprot:8163554-Karenia_brevis.AAC.1